MVRKSFSAPTEKRETSVTRRYRHEEGRHRRGNLASSLGFPGMSGRHNRPTSREVRRVNESQSPRRCCVRKVLVVSALAVAVTTAAIVLIIAGLEEGFERENDYTGG